VDLREKALWGFVGVIIVTMVVLASLSFFLIAGSYLDLESTYVRSDVNLVTKSIDSELKSLKSNTPDWGAWNDTYNFVLGENPDFVTANLGNTTFKTIRANFIIITDREGRIRYGRGYDLVSDTPAPLRPDLVAELEKGQILVRTLGGTEGISGFLDLPQGPAILSSYQVLHSDYTGPAQGMVIIGRYVDDAELGILTQGTTLSLSIRPFDHSTVRQEDLALLSGTGDSAIVVQPLDENTVQATKVIRDIYGRDDLLLTIQLPRDIYEQGKATIFIFIMLQFGIMLVLGILGVLVLDRTVLERMSAISSDITGITERKNLSARIGTTGNDELSRLAVAMNTLLDQIEKNQSELQESELKFREIFNNVNDSIELHDFGSDGIDGKFLEVNDVTCRMLQYSREELLRISLPDFTTGYYNRPVNDIGKEINTLGHSRFETEYRRKDGTIVPVEINAHVVVLHGKTMVLSAVRDIAERKKAEEVLKQVIKKLNILSSITRHDILNQLTGLRGYLELSKHLATDTKLCEFIRKEETAANAIQVQISFTKDYQDIGINSPQWQDVKKIILQAIRPLSTEPARVSVDIEGTDIYADPLLEKVFFNLVENAIRHGGSITGITFTQKESADGLLIICEDDGVGIPLSEKVNIFNRKYYRNTGLGLFLVREILGMTGIAIRETGEPGEGARFEISVPKGVYRFSQK